MAFICKAWTDARGVRHDLAMWPAWYNYSGLNDYLVAQYGGAVIFDITWTPDENVGRLGSGSMWIKPQYIPEHATAVTVPEPLLADTRRDPPPPATRPPPALNSNGNDDETVIWRNYPDETLELICTRLGGESACQELRRRGRPVTSDLPTTTTNPPPTTNPTTTTTTNPPDPMASNSDGTTTSPDTPSTEKTAWEKLLANDEKVLGFVEAVAESFLPVNSTAPKPAAVTKPEEPSWKKVPWWIWAIVAGLGYLALKRR